MQISPTFYEQLFCTKVFCAAFLKLQFGFVIFWQKEISAKACVYFTIQHCWATFTNTDSKSAKRHWWLDCLFALLGSGHVKAALKHVGEIDNYSDYFATIIKHLKTIFSFLSLQKGRQRYRTSVRLQFGLNEDFISIGFDSRESTRLLMYVRMLKKAVVQPAS